MIIYVFNCFTNILERYILEPYDNMPYTNHNSLSVRDFCMNSHSDIAWTTLSAMISWNSFYRLTSGSVSLVCGFKRICEGGHPPQSQHYSGTAMDFSILYNKDRIHLPLSSSYHKNRYGYPPISLGSTGVYVFVLQDALYTLGISPGALDGFFGVHTHSALCEFQRSFSLNVTGQADTPTWRKLTFLASGIGNINKIPYL